MQSLLQIIKVNDERTIPARGDRGAFQVQDAECILLDEDGSPQKVGVLRVPGPLKPMVKVGTFLGTFGLEPSYKDRTIQAVLTGLTEVRKSGNGYVAAATPAK